MLLASPLGKIVGKSNWCKTTICLGVWFFYHSLEALGLWLFCVVFYGNEKNMRVNVPKPLWLSLINHGLKSQFNLHVYKRGLWCEKKATQTLVFSRSNWRYNDLTNEWKHNQKSETCQGKSPFPRFTHDMYCFYVGL